MNLRKTTAPEAVPVPLLKICGLRRSDQAVAVASSGADAVGVIAVEGSPRWLEPPLRPGLFAALHQSSSHCLGVLVVADPGDDELDSLRPEQGGHDVVQLHGRESPQRCRQLAEQLGCPLWKALRVRQPADLQRVMAYAGAVDAVLLDAWVPDQLGGSGQRIPIEWLSGFQPAMPWWLAGGISPENVAAVLAAVQPDGLDVSSSVELAPGLKDLGRVSQLIEAIGATVRLAP
ncbi:phosphoribosylanthranilate isomerase [Synechococcus sp. CS-1325]|nr:phosphoribosylanthranilate isomerase [Synechococcus sp. CS-1325]PZV02504.1 MAG: phosphoribosylanthranilate isomerase [Cyanobium sp.]